MSKALETIFKIGGQISSSFPSSFREASKTLSDFGSRVEKTQDKLKKLNNLSKKGLMVAGAGAAAMTIPVKLAIDAESAMADFKKVFSGTEAELKKFQKDFLKISSETGRSFTDITTIAAAAAQSGIQKADITAFTNDAVKMGIAFDISAEQAGQSMAEMRTAFKMSQDEVRDLADKINLLGNSTPQASSKIMEITQRVGPLASLANISAENVAALGSSMVALEPDVAATAIKKVIQSMTAGEAASKSMRAAYADLGLDVSNVSAAVQKDSTRTMLTILNGINKLPKKDQAANLSNIFGLEGIAGTSQLVDNLPNLIKNLEAVAEANKNATDGWGGSMLREYDSRAATTEMAMARAKESMKNAGIQIGTTLLPALTSLSEIVAKVAQRFADWGEKNPELVATLSKAAVVSIAVVGGLSALSIGFVALFGPIAMAVKMMGGMIGAAGKLFSSLRYLATCIPWIIEITKWLASGLWLKGVALIKAVGTAFMWLGRVFLMNPIGLAVTAAVAAIALLYYNWDTVTKFIGSAWENIKGFFSSGIANIAATIINFSPIGLFYQAFAAVLSWFGIDLPSKFTEFGKNMIQGLINGISSMMGTVVEKAKSIANKITSAVKDKFKIKSPSRVFAEFGMYNMQGLANGMSNNAHLPQQAANDASLNSIPTMPSQTSTNKTTNNTTNAGVTLNITQNITVSGNASMGEVKQAASQGLNDALTAFQEYQQRQARLAY